MLLCVSDERYAGTRWRTLPEWDHGSGEAGFFVQSKSNLLLQLGVCQNFSFLGSKLSSYFDLAMNVDEKYCMAYNNFLVVLK